MKVLNLRCANGHVFEGWFGSEDDYLDQNGRAAIECPMCGDHAITRMLSAPRLNLGAAPPQGSAAHVAQAPATSAAGASVSTIEGRDEPRQGKGSAADGPPAELQAAWLRAVREVIVRTDDVGERFAEEARRMHYGEIPNRGIRGQASPEEREALLEEGIETLALPMPNALKGPLQ